MIRVKGDANVRGKIAYVPQQAWMQNATLKNNILFGTEYKQDLYEKVSCLPWKLMTFYNATLGIGSGAGCTVEGSWMLK